jgi:hypothetical protein
LSDQYPNLPSGAYTVETLYTTQVADPRTDPVTGTCRAGEAECFSPTSLWQGAAPAGTTRIAKQAVTAGNNPPIAVPQAATTNEDTAKVLTLVASDVDNASLTFAIATPPTKGTLSALSAPSCVSVPSSSGANCTVTVTYTPTANLTGADSFAFTVSDGLAPVSAPALVSLTITPVNDPPVFNPIANQTVAEDAGPQSVLITGVAAGPGTATDEASQTVTVSALSSNPLVVPTPTFTGTGAVLTGTNTAPAFTGTAFNNRPAYKSVIFCSKT